jgi:hypothetical protein
MTSYSEKWHPGSFTKNPGWGQEGEGLYRLHRAIRVGFANTVGDVRRAEFRERVEKDEKLNFFVIANFFLFSYLKDGEDFIACDELVFQALHFPHTNDFDKLAIFAFNLSLAGKWKGAKPYQRRPAIWSNRYIVERLAKVHDWDSSKATSDDIQSYLENDKRWTAKTTRKVSTNLHYLYIRGGLPQLTTKLIERWWMDAAFLAADRLCGLGVVRTLDQRALESAMVEFEFHPLSGGPNIERELLLKSMINLYISVSGLLRFKTETVIEDENLENEVFALVDRKVPRAPKALPASSRLTSNELSLNYEVLNAKQLDQFDPDCFVREMTLRALSHIEANGMTPSIDSEELYEITRG